MQYGTSEPISGARVRGLRDNSDKHVRRGYSTGWTERIQGRHHRRRSASGNTSGDSGAEPLTAPRRRLSVNAQYEDGPFYSGQRRRRLQPGRTQGRPPSHGWLRFCVKGGMRYWILSVLVCTTCAASLCSGAFGQSLSFGVITGANLTDDFQSGTIFRPSSPNILCGNQPCPSQTLSSSDASSHFIIGPKLELRLTDAFSVEVDALHRTIRRRTRTDYSPPLDFGNGFTLAIQTSHATDYTWEVPVLAQYRLKLLARDSFLEAGPTFRPAENNKQNGITAGAGVNVAVAGMVVSPRVRYSRWVEKYSPDPLYRLSRPRSNQLSFLVGIGKPSTAQRASTFGQGISIGGVAGLGLTGDFSTRVDYMGTVPTAEWLPRPGVLSWV